MDLYLHCGDSQSMPQLITPFIQCKGNCDYYEEILQEVRIPTPQGLLLMRHIPNMLHERLKKENVRFYIYGHTHIKTFYEEDGIYHINPGSITYPRDSKNGSYLLLDVEKDNIKYEFKEV